MTNQRMKNPSADNRIMGLSPDMMLHGAPNIAPPRSSFDAKDAMRTGLANEYVKQAGVGQKLGGLLRSMPTSLPPAPQGRAGQAPMNFAPDMFDPDMLGRATPQAQAPQRAVPSRAAPWQDPGNAYSDPFLGATPYVPPTGTAATGVRPEQGYSYGDEGNTYAYDPNNPGQGLPTISREQGKDVLSGARKPSPGAAPGVKDIGDVNGPLVGKSIGHHVIDELSTGYDKEGLADYGYSEDDISNTINQMQQQAGDILNQQMASLNEQLAAQGLAGSGFALVHQQNMKNDVLFDLQTKVLAYEAQQKQAAINTKLSALQQMAAAGNIDAQNEYAKALLESNKLDTLTNVTQWMQEYADQNNVPSSVMNGFMDMLAASETAEDYMEVWKALLEWGQEEKPGESAIEDAPSGSGGTAAKGHTAFPTNRG